VSDFLPINRGACHRDEGGEAAEIAVVAHPARHSQLLFCDHCV